MARKGDDGSLYRADGVRITHDPNSPGMAEKYGAPGSTDRDGFDPYADSVGAGIYSGTVVRDGSGAVVIGRQYQDHNPQPGPVYSSGGYTPMSRAIASFRAETQGASAAETSTLAKLLAQHPDLVNDVSTGGALPLHTCGMSRENQHAAAFLAARGADLDALDTYGYTPLHRMASNNLAVGAQALLDAGADPQGLAGFGGTDSTPLDVAKRSRASAVVTVLERFGPRRRSADAATTGVASTLVSSVVVMAGGYAPVRGRYFERVGDEASAPPPAGFAAVCEQNGWDVVATWRKLNGGEGGRWFAHEDNESYIYYNRQDQSWWIDGPDGLGAFKARGAPWAPPASSIRWTSLRQPEQSCPTLAVLRGADSSAPPEDC